MSRVFCDKKRSENQSVVVLEEARGVVTDDKTDNVTDKQEYCPEAEWQGGNHDTNPDEERQEKEVKLECS